MRGRGDAIARPLRENERRSEDDCCTISPPLETEYRWEEDCFTTVRLEYCCAALRSTPVGSDA